LKSILVILLFFIVLNIYSKNDLPIMLKVKSNFNLDDFIINTFRSGAEDSLTAHGYVLISRQQQDEALLEQAKQSKSDCYDDACLVDTGKMMAAQMIFIIDINKTEEQYIFKIRLLDLETGTVKRTVTKLYKERLSDVDKLLTFSKKLTNEVLFINKKQNAVALFKVNINSSKPGASVYIDSELVGKTPLLARVGKGRHKFKISLDKYDDVIYNEEIRGDSSKMVKLTPILYLYKISSNPSKAKVYLNEEYKGLTPLDIKLDLTAIGSSITIVKKNFYKYKHKINKDNLDKGLNLNLVELDKFKLIVNVNHSDAKIIISNEELGKFDLKSGESNELYKGLYSLIIKKKDFKTYNNYIELTKDIEKDVEIIRNYVKYLKIQAITDVTVAKNLLYLGVGAGVEVFNYVNGNREITLFGANFYRNMADKYFYSDIYSNIKWEIVSGLSLGVNLSLILGDEVKTVAGGALVEYKYTVANLFSIKAFFKGGITYFDEQNALDFDLLYLTTGISVSSIGF